MTSPVAGFRTGSVWPSARSTNSPSMKFFRVGTWVVVVSVDMSLNVPPKTVPWGRISYACPHHCDQPESPDRKDFMTDVVIASAARTAIGSYGKSLAGVAPTDLGATAASAAMERAGI